MTNTERRLLGRALFATNLLLLVAGLASQVVKYVFHHDYAHGLIPLFDLNAEANLPTWYSSMLLFAAALVAGRYAARIGTPRRRQWAMLSAVLLAFSVEEIASLHEQGSEAMQAALGLSGVFFYAWVIPGMAVVALLAVVFFTFFRDMEPKLRRGLILGSLVFFGGALGLEMVGGALESAAGTRETLTYAIWAAAEESCEMFGSTIWLLTLLGGEKNNDVD
ncbi:MAG: hypothetical protein P9L99_04565 [Candidatus Lernaella stagnicola]|nr:hypothetical protein [Candidatus Lernaella stagnicola]